tara:strand:- start:2990 stop:3655 length:666 start_codon:yes stop_codon:yes gene_type:complete
MSDISSCNSNDSKDIRVPKSSFVYNFVSFIIVFPIFKILLRGTVIGKENVPKNIPIIVVSNHGSHFDPPIIGHALGRPVAFMAKAELFKIPFIGFLIRKCGAYPVRRGASDREAIKSALLRLQEGWATGIFLDGTRQDNGLVNNPMQGAAFLSARTGIPLLPIAIINTHRALPVGAFIPRLIPVQMKIGKLIPAPCSKKRFDLENKTKEVQENINLMINEA